MISASPLITTYVSVPLCGETRSIDFGDEHWIISCTQSPDHEGPHVGMISWEATS